MKASEWPTLREMIDSGKRVVTFLDTGAEQGDVPFLIHQFDNVRPSFPIPLTPLPLLSPLTLMLARILDLGAAILGYGPGIPVQGRPDHWPPQAGGDHVYA